VDSGRFKPAMAQFAAAVRNGAEMKAGAA